MRGQGRKASLVKKLIVGSAILLVILAGTLSANLLAGDDQRAERMIKGTCAGCHKFTGEAESRFNLKAPDLMWAGSKYKRDWLIRWLTGKEKPIYIKGYRWDLARGPTQHMAVSEEAGKAIADYFEKHYKDPRVMVGAMDLSTFTAKEAEFGRQIYMEHACVGCHLVRDNGKIVGGPQSASLVEAGKRYNLDWLYRFGVNPQDFTPHSGEFLADASTLGLRYIIGYVAIQGVDDFRFYEPWTSAEFQRASVERGSVLYKQYCSQCHGAAGMGDGPAASGLVPKPAMHAKIAFDKLPMDYLYNVINHGGRSVGKSPTMPYWNRSIGQQGVADVIAYLKTTFKAAPQVAQATPSADGKPLGVCPQPRKTAKAPGEYRKMTNPLPSSTSHLKAGETLFQQSAKPLACAQCHGPQGDGNGVLGAALVPPPRNFTCGSMMDDISDGQLYWIIKNGSMGTGMMAFSGLSDDEAWQLVHYIRSLAR